MQIVTPGFNEQLWSGQVQCVGPEPRIPNGPIKAVLANIRTKEAFGCGSVLRVMKHDLYVVEKWDMSRMEWEARFTCICCGVESVMPLGHLFTNLPKKEEWQRKQAEEKGEAATR